MSCTAFCEIGTLQNGDIWRVMSASSHGHTERYDQSTVTLFLESTKPADSICCSEHRLLTGSKTISPQIAPLGHARIAVSVELHMETTPVPLRRRWAHGRQPRPLACTACHSRRGTTCLRAVQDSLAKEKKSQKALCTNPAAALGLTNPSFLSEKNEEVL